MGFHRVAEWREPQATSILDGKCVEVFLELNPGATNGTTLMSEQQSPGKVGKTVYDIAAKAA
jgi:hypothetical protein